MLRLRSTRSRGRFCTAASDPRRCAAVRLVDDNRRKRPLFLSSRCFLQSSERIGGWQTSWAYHSLTLLPLQAAEQDLAPTSRWWIIIIFPRKDAHDGVARWKDVFFPPFARLLFSHFLFSAFSLFPRVKDVFFYCSFDLWPNAIKTGVSLCSCVIEPVQMRWTLFTAPCSDLNKANNNNNTLAVL